VIPVVTVQEMRAIDAASPVPVAVLIERAGAAVARVAIEEMGGWYGRRVVVVAGKGNNGADGRAAAARLARRGVRVQVIDAGSSPSRVPPCDLVIDAAYGTGFRGSYAAPDPGAATVLAVDVPSGDTVADVTVAFAALKPSLLFSRNAGAVVVEDIGLDVSCARIHAVEASDVRFGVPQRAPDAHKYAAAVAVVAGAPGMSGAAALTATAAMRAGSGYVRLALPGIASGEGVSGAPIEAVRVSLDGESWAGAALDACDRMQVLAIGPGLGRREATLAAVREVVAKAPIPCVIDADALFALGDLDAAAALLRSRSAPAVLTPHDGEFASLAGAPPADGEDRIDCVRGVAARLGCTVLLKGPVTIVAAPDGAVLVAHRSSSALATAGTGDVLTGVIAAFVARGLDPLRAAAFAAVASGAAAVGAPGLVAGDLPVRIAQFLAGGPS